MTRQKNQSPRVYSLADCIHQRDTLYPLSTVRHHRQCRPATRAHRVVRRQRSTSFSFDNNKKRKTKQSFVLLVLSHFKLPIEQQSETVAILFVIVVESEKLTKKIVCKSVRSSVSSSASNQRQLLHINSNPTLR